MDMILYFLRITHIKMFKSNKGFHDLMIYLLSQFRDHKKNRVGTKRNTSLKLLHQKPTQRNALNSPEPLLEDTTGTNFGLLMTEIRVHILQVADLRHSCPLGTSQLDILGSFNSSISFVIINVSESGLDDIELNLQFSWLGCARETTNSFLHGFQFRPSLAD